MIYYFTMDDCSNKLNFKEGLEFEKGEYKLKKTGNSQVLNFRLRLDYHSGGEFPFKSIPGIRDQILSPPSC